MPDAATICTNFNEPLRVGDLPDLQARLNSALAADIPERVRQRAGKLAIYFQDRPQSRNTDQAQRLYVHDKARDDTMRFHRIALAFGLHRHLCVTLARRFVLPEEPTVTLVTRLKTLGLRAGTLFLDRGFAGISVCDYLMRLADLAPTACPIQSNKERQVGTPRGTNALWQGRASYRAAFTYHGKAGANVMADMANCRVFTIDRHRRVLWRRDE